MSAPEVNRHPTGRIDVGATSRSGGSASCGIDATVYIDLPAHRTWIRDTTGV